ncbi:hypothetical protein [Acinetobacter soli]|uniref:hypothetical protein n=1 Tax=Acinetobacter soli TaxID=487316 RepID=UPI00124FF5D9|nr:hypothetical protein [Acinetobacter soli]
MIKFKEISGLTLDNTANLPQIQRTDDGKNIGHIPGWKYFIDPEYASGTSVRNRALANSISNASRAVTTLIQNDDVLFDFKTTALRIDSNSNVAINPNEFTMFAVVNAAQSTSSYPLWIFRGNTTSTTSAPVDDIPNFCISPNGGQCSVFKRITDNTYDQLVTNNLRVATFALNKNLKTNSGLSLLILSFNTNTGYTLSQDGVVIGTVAYKTPLANNLNDFSSFRNMAGVAGKVGIFDIDLHSAANTVYRKQLEKYLKNKYGII